MNFLILFGVGRLRSKFDLECQSHFEKGFLVSKYEELILQNAEVNMCLNLMLSVKGQTYKIQA